MVNNEDYITQQEIAEENISEHEQKIIDSLVDLANHGRDLAEQGNVEESYKVLKQIEALLPGLYQDIKMEWAEEAKIEDAGKKEEAIAEAATVQRAAPEAAATAKKIKELSYQELMVNTQERKVLGDMKKKLEELYKKIKNGKKHADLKADVDQSIVKLIEQLRTLATLDKKELQIHHMEALLGYSEHADVKKIQHGTIRNLVKGIRKVDRLEKELGNLIQKENSLLRILSSIIGKIRDANSKGPLNVLGGLVNNTITVIDNLLKINSAELKKDKKVTKHLKNIN